MNPRTTAVLALVALALGAFVYFNEIEGDVAREAAEDEAKQIHPGLEADAIHAITLTTQDGIDARFERRDGRWFVASPLEAPADATSLDAIASALTNLPREGSVAPSADAGRVDLERFGLGAGAQTIRFEVGDETRGLRIGRTTPVGGHRYVARLADDEIAYVASYRVNAFSRDFEDLRDRQIFDFETDAVRTLRVAWPVAGDPEPFEVALARDADGEWQLGVPVVGPADQATLRDLLSDLAFLRAEGFVDERTDALVDALGRPEITFSWTLEGDHVERRARIASLADGLRILERPDGALFTIAPERLDDFPRQLADYRFKRLADFALSAARRVELQFSGDGGRSDGDVAGPDDAGGGARAVVAVLGDGGWESERSRLDPDRFSDLVRALATLEADSIAADEMGSDERASLGLDPPRVRIVVSGTPETSQAGTPGGGTDSSEGDAPLAEVWLGRLEPGRGLFAMRADQPTIFVLPTLASEDLPISAARFAEEFELETESESSDADESGDVTGDVLKAPPPDPDPLEGVELP